MPSPMQQAWRGFLAVGRVLCLGGAVAVGSGAAQAATVPIGVSVGAGARAVLGPNDFSFADRASFAWGGPGSLGLGYEAVAGDNVHFIRARMGVEADWTSADAGQIRLNWGWNWQTEGSDATPAGAYTNMTPALRSLPLNWSYEFTATADGWFFGSFDVASQGDPFGLQFLTLVESNGGLLQSLGSGPDAVGSFMIPLQAGQAYAFGVYNFGNLFIPPPNGANLNRDAAAAAVIDWGIRYVNNPVPLPGTGLLLLCGLGALTLRRVADTNCR